MVGEKGVVVRHGERNQELQVEVVFLSHMFLPSRNSHKLHPLGPKQGEFGVAEWVTLQLLGTASRDNNDLLQTDQNTLLWQR